MDNVQKHKNCIIYHRHKRLDLTIENCHGEAEKQAVSDLDSKIQVERYRNVVFLQLCLSRRDQRSSFAVVSESCIVPILRIYLFSPVWVPHNDLRVFPCRAVC
jgi:hypothetical protein